MKIAHAAKFVRNTFPGLDSSAFENLLQISYELKNLGFLKSVCSNLESQHKHDLSESIKVLAELEKDCDCGDFSNESIQVCYSTGMELVEQAKILLRQGKILVCDDLMLWKHLQHSLMDYAYLPYDFVEKLHLYFLKPSRISALNMLCHPFLKKLDVGLAEETLMYEFLIRKNYEKDFWKEYVFKNDLAKLLLESKSIHDLPDYLKKLLLTEYIEFLESLDWYKVVVALKMHDPRIRFGLHYALLHSPERVVFCLKYPQIRPLLCQKLVRDCDLKALLRKWQGNVDISALALSKSNLFEHPLLNGAIETFKPLRIEISKELPVANPTVSSRPKVVSASGLSQLMQDPYGFYARYILNLPPLRRSDINDSAREFGIYVHKIVEIYIKQGYESALTYIDQLNLETPKILLHGRLLRIINWIDRQINELKPIEVISEKEFEFALNNGILVKARIDACIFTNKGNLVVNFKTGTPASKAEVLSGYCPQLLIEIFLFQGLHNLTSVQGEFWQLKGTQPAGVVFSNIAMTYDAIRNNLENVTNHYLQKESPFLACPWPLKKPKYNEYFYLERVGNEGI